MFDQQHTVKRQVLDITLASQDDAYHIQTKVSDLYRHKILPLMDEVFNEFVDEQTLLKVDALTFDLGTIDYDYLEEEITVKVKQQLREQLTEKVLKKDLPDSRVQMVNIDESDLQLLIFFLENGQYPWWVKNANAVDWVEVLQRVIQQQKKQLKNSFIRLLQQKDTRQRLVYQFPVKSLLSIVEMIHKDIAETIEKVVHDFQLLWEKSTTLTTESGRTFTIYLWEKSLQFVATENHILNVEKWEQKLIGFQWQQLIQKAQISQQEFLKEIKIALAKINDFNLKSKSKTITFVETLISRVNGEKSIAEGSLDTATNIQLENEIETPDEQRGQPEKESESEQDSTTKLTTKETPESEDKIKKTQAQQYEIQHEKRKTKIDEGDDITAEKDGIESDGEVLEKEALIQQLISSQGEIANDTSIFDQPEITECFIENSGLIFLWPFLPNYFKKLGLVEGQEFVNKKAQKRAVLLLQFLAAGKHEIPEHQLVLNKIICGMDMREPVPKNIRITKQEKEESEALIKAVVKNWAALKNMSVDGFRGSFMIRDGVLRKQRMGWQLKVEQKTYDILMDQLPWPISVVKCPWMKQALHVEW